MSAASPPLVHDGGAQATNRKFSEGSVPASVPSPSSCHSSGHSASLGSLTSRRFCSAPGCGRMIGSVAKDPHTVCIPCRGEICDVDKRCPECELWDSELVHGAFKHQLSLQRKRNSRSSRKGNTHTPTTESLPVFPDVLVSEGAQDTCLGDSGDEEDSHSVVIEPTDSVSLASERRESTVGVDSSHSMFSNFFHEFSTFFGFSGERQHSTFRDMVSDLVSQEFRVQLASNALSLSVCSMPSA